jgi:rhomboid protease GluP
MLERQTSGSISCPSCHKMISVDARTCPHCDRRNPSLWGYKRSLQKLGDDFGVIPIVMGGCFLLYVITLALAPNEIRWGGIGVNALFGFLAPSSDSLFICGSTGAKPVFEAGRWWTVLSGGWLHVSFFHLAFNLAVFRYLALQIAQFCGASRLVIFYTISIITGAIFTSSVGHYFDNLPALLQGAPVAVGASGGVFGLLGALVAYGQMQGDSEIVKNNFQFFVVGFVGGLLLGADNWGHFGGFLGGYLVTRLPWFNPQKRESHGHLLIAIALLAASFLSVIASVVHAYLFIGDF